MFERPGGGERCVLLGLQLPAPFARTSIDEFRELALAAGAAPVGQLGGTRKSPDPRYFIGAGKLAELRELVRERAADLVLVNHELSPAQERNLERELQCRVLDRTGLILDIFAQRARSFEGKLQVELAQLEHLASRLVRGWTHLERQKGGIGLRGPGETQLETDRRLLAQRIKQIHKRLEKVRRQREQGRQARRKAAAPTVALVGYTNAGKSTLFNRLTDAGVWVADQLFATLDPTLRRLALPGGQHAVLADTVGFLRNLPHELVEAFLSTLQETREARLLLHVVDASDADHRERQEDVARVLQQIGADGVRQLLVYNKIDLCGLESGVDYDAQGVPVRVRVSAREGTGVARLLAAIDQLLAQPRVHGWIYLGPQQARQRALLYANDAVCDEQAQADGGSLLEIDMEAARWQRLVSREGLPEQALVQADSARLATPSQGQ